MALTKVTRSVTETTAKVPVGGIVIWSGSIATIPSGWALCNGTNGTPDLRNKFVIAAYADAATIAQTTVTGTYTQTGGSKDAIVISHSHTATSSDTGHSHTVGPYGAWHGYGGRGNPGYPTWDGGDSYNGDAYGFTNSGTANITTTINSAGSSGTNANLPPYYAVAFIMKT